MFVFTDTCWLLAVLCGFPFACVQTIPTSVSVAPDPIAMYPARQAKAACLSRMHPDGISASMACESLVVAALVPAAATRFGAPRSAWPPLANVSFAHDDSPSIETGGPAGLRPAAQFLLPVLNVAGAVFLMYVAVVSRAAAGIQNLPRWMPGGGSTARFLPLLVVPPIRPCWQTFLECSPYLQMCSVVKSTSFAVKCNLPCCWRRRERPWRE